MGLSWVSYLFVSTEWTFCYRLSKKFLQKNAFFFSLKLPLNASVTLTFAFTKRRNSDIIRAWHELLNYINFAFSIHFKICVQAVTYGQIAKKGIYCHLFSWPWPCASKLNPSLKHDAKLKSSRGLRNLPPLATRFNQRFFHIFFSKSRCVWPCSDLDLWPTDLKNFRLKN